MNFADGNDYDMFSLTNIVENECENNYNWINCVSSYDTQCSYLNGTLVNNNGSIFCSGYQGCDALMRFGIKL